MARFWVVRFRFEVTLEGVSDVTRILNAIERGDAQSTDELLPVVYQELRRMAAHKMSNQPAGHTLQPTALVHEAYLRLVDLRRVPAAKIPSVVAPVPCI